ncbi:MAG: hypothetical protein ABSG43_10015 [Solirubrobacteraceae bacterium]
MRLGVHGRSETASQRDARRARRAWKVGLLVAALVLVGAIGAIALSYPFAWPTRVLRVYIERSADDQAGLLATAVDKWDEANVGVRFEFTRSRRDANVIVAQTGSEHAARGACHEFPWADSVQACVDWVGWKPWGATRMEILSPDSIDAEFTDTVAAHELGHVLGLMHTHAPDKGPRCRIMNPNADCSANDTFSASALECTRRACTQVVTRRWICGPEPGDVAAARALYHGAGDPSYSPYCQRVVRVSFPPAPDLIGLARAGA